MIDRKLDKEYNYKKSPNRDSVEFITIPNYEEEIIIKKERKLKIKIRNKVLFNIKIVSNQKEIAKDIFNNVVITEEYSYTCFEYTKSSWIPSIKIILEKIKLKIF